MVDPQTSDDLKGHFKTYLEMINCSPADRPKYTPQQMSDLGRCSIYTNWHFNSITEIQKHKRLLHPKVQLQKLLKVNPGSEVPNLFICSHKINEKQYGLSFPTYYQSHKHKEKSGHKRKRAEEAKNDGDKRSKKAKKISAQKKSVKNFFQKKTNKRKVINISNDELRKTLMKLRKTLRKRMNNHPMKKARPSLVRRRIVTLTQWPKPKEP